MHKHKQAKGSVSIEFAVILPLLLLIMYSLIAYSVLFAYKASVDNFTQALSRDFIQVSHCSDVNAIASRIIEQHRQATWMAIQADEVSIECIDDRLTLRVSVEPPKIPSLTLMNITIPGCATCLEATASIHLRP